MDDGEFLREAFHDSWALRYKLNSNLLVLVGAVNEDDSKEGAFYYVFTKDAFKLIHKTLFHSKCKG
jgi:hypothetical protein